MGAAKSKPNMEEIIEQRLKESAKPREKETGKIRRSIQGENIRLRKEIAAEQNVALTIY